MKLQAEQLSVMGGIYRGRERRGGMKPVLAVDVSVIKAWVVVYLRDYPLSCASCPVFLKAHTNFPSEPGRLLRKLVCSFGSSPSWMSFSSLPS